MTEPAARTLTVLQWAEERFSNTFDIAATKTGADREGWLEDAEYWRQIVDALRGYEGLQREHDEVRDELGLAAGGVGLSFVEEIRRLKTAPALHAGDEATR